MDLTNPIEQADVALTSMTVHDDSTTVNFEGEIGKYGAVFGTITLTSLYEGKTRGLLDGNARAILEDGTMLSSPLTGTWTRDGGEAKFFFCDCVDNGDQNFVVWDVNFREKKASIRVYSLL
jgi:hypothetical protein